MSELDFIERVSQQDWDTLKLKAKTYGDSWKKSGGRSAWFMLKRKIDRLVNILNKEPKDLKEAKAQHDVFESIMADPSGKDGTTLAEIRDLRCYLLLVEAEMMRQGVINSGPPEKDDESLHAKYDPVSDVEKLKQTLPLASRYSKLSGPKESWESRQFGRE